MIRFLIRSLGLWLAAGGFAAAVVDGTKSIAASRLVVTPAAITWRDLSPASFESAATALEHGLGAGVLEGGTVHDSENYSRSRNQ